MKKLLPLLSAVAVVGATAIGHAATIDFTQAPWNTQTSVNVDGVTVTVSSPNGSVDYVAGSGLGVNSGSVDVGDDINFGENLVVTFSQKIDIATITLYALDTNTSTQGTKTTVVLDRGTWTALVNGTPITGPYDASTNPKDSNGFSVVNISEIAKSISITSSGTGDRDASNHRVFTGFYLADISTPELSTKGLTSAAAVFAGVGILFGSRRRRLLGPVS